MRRFVQYLYEYQDGKRIQNLGFVKVEASGDLLVIQIYGKGFPAAENQTLEIFLFYMEEGTCVGLPVGTISGRRPMLNYHLQIRPDDVGEEAVFHKIAGVIVKNHVNEREKCYAAVWGEQAENLEHMKKASEIAEEKSEDNLEEAPSEEVPPEEVLPSEEVPPEEVLSQEVPSQKESVPEEETVAALETEETVQSYEQNQVYKITRQDLVKLPRREWKLANNHFLMHGCRNYHHLISFEKDGSSWLGVPGIYHPQEERAAQAFGFGEFMVPDENDVMLEEDERASQGDFGYWCRIVSNIIRR